MQQPLAQLRDELTKVQLPFDLPGAAKARATANQLANQLEDYILPRIENLGAPLLVVVGGSTGAGKSTLVNTLVNRVISKPGVIRPTTKSPVLLCNPEDEHWFSTNKILPSLTRTYKTEQDSRKLQLVKEASWLKGLALLDTPDIDSVDDQNRVLANQLLQAGDLWLFCTTAARYSDAVPWEFLTEAANRSAAVAVVCNRVPPAGTEVVPAHLSSMMAERGLDQSPLFVIPETETDQDAMLPEQTVAPIRDWLTKIAADETNRSQVIKQTLRGAIDAVVAAIPGIADKLVEQTTAVERLAHRAEKIFGEAKTQLLAQTENGTMLQGEVLASWNDFVGSSNFTKALNKSVSTLRDKIGRFFRGMPPEGKRVRVAAVASLEGLMVEQVTYACELVGEKWRQDVAGRKLLESTSVNLARPSQDLVPQAEMLVAQWQQDVLDMVVSQGENKLSRARIAALGVNSVAAVLIIAVFASTGGLTGAEVGIAGGVSVASQKLLESIFGDEAVRKLASQAKEMLHERISQLIQKEFSRFETVINQFRKDYSPAERLQEILARIEVDK